MQSIDCNNSLSQLNLIDEEEQSFPFTCNMLMEKSPFHDYECALILQQHADEEVQAADVQLQFKQTVHTCTTKALKQCELDVTDAHQTVIMARLALEKAAMELLRVQNLMNSATMNLNLALNLRDSATKEDLVASEEFSFAKVDYFAAKQEANFCSRKLEWEKEKLGV